MKGQVEGQLTLFQEGSLVSRSPLPGSSEARKMTVISGRKWLGLSKNSGLLGSLEKMLLESSEWHSPIFYLSWKPVDIGQGHFLFQLAVSEPDIGDTGWQSWPTPTAANSYTGKMKSTQQKPGSRHSVDLPSAVQEPAMWKTPVAADAANREMYVNSRGEPNLSGQVKIWPTPKASLRGDCPSERNRRSPDLAAAVKMWPTPTAQDYKRRGPNSRQQGLPEQVRMYNTPTAQDAKNSTLPQSQIKRDSLVRDIMREMFAIPQARDYRTGQASCWEDKEHRSRNLNDQIAMYPTPTTDCAGGRTKKYKQGGTPLTAAVQENGNGQLNPYWVEWLMGFPVGWTEI